MIAMNACAHQLSLMLFNFELSTSCCLSQMKAEKNADWNGFSECGECRVEPTNEEKTESICVSKLEPYALAECIIVARIRQQFYNISIEIKEPAELNSIWLFFFFCCDCVAIATVYVDFAAFNRCLSVCACVRKSLHSMQTTFKLNTFLLCHFSSSHIQRTRVSDTWKTMQVNVFLRRFFFFFSMSKSFVASFATCFCFLTSSS